MSSDPHAGLVARIPRLDADFTFPCPIPPPSERQGLLGLGVMTSDIRAAVAAAQKTGWKKCSTSQKPTQKAINAAVQRLGFRPADPIPNIGDMAPGEFAGWLAALDTRVAQEVQALVKGLAPIPGLPKEASRLVLAFCAERAVRRPILGHLVRGLGALDNHYRPRQLNRALATVGFQWLTPEEIEGATPTAPSSGAGAPGEAPPATVGAAQERQRHVEGALFALGLQGKLGDAVRAVRAENESKLPEHIDRFGRFMIEMTAGGAPTPRAVVTAYAITIASIQRGAITYTGLVQGVRKNLGEEAAVATQLILDGQLNLPVEERNFRVANDCARTQEERFAPFQGERDEDGKMTARPEDYMARLLCTPTGQVYVRQAARGSAALAKSPDARREMERAAAWLSGMMRPFSKTGLRDDTVEGLVEEITVELTSQFLSAEGRKPTGKELIHLQRLARSEAEALYPEAPKVPTRKGSPPPPRWYAGDSRSGALPAPATFFGGLLRAVAVADFAGKLTEMFAEAGRDRMTLLALAEMAFRPGGAASSASSASTGDEGAGDEGAEDEGEDQKALPGIKYAKVGFISALLGRGFLPTLDSREWEFFARANGVFSVADVVAISPAPAAMVRALSENLRALHLDLPEELRPYYDHLAHHFVWDAAGGAAVTHASLMACLAHAQGLTPEQRKGITGAAPDAPSAPLGLGDIL